MKTELRTALKELAQALVTECGAGRIEDSTGGLFKAAEVICILIENEEREEVKKAHKPKCSVNRVAHTCPFLEDVHGDKTTLCNCCKKCTEQCGQDI